MTELLTIPQIIELLSEDLLVSRISDYIDLKTPQKGHYTRNCHLTDGSPTSIKVTSPDESLFNIRIAIPDKSIHISFQLMAEDLTREEFKGRFAFLAALCQGFPAQEASYFYTEKFPYRWGGAPVLLTLDAENEFEPIPSLARAKEIAEKLRVQGYNEDSCETTYGIQYKVN